MLTSALHLGIFYMLQIYNMGSTATEGLKRVVNFRSELSVSFRCGRQRMEPSNLCEFACYKKVKLNYLQSKTTGIAVPVCSTYSYQQQNSRQGTCSPLQGIKVAYQVAYSFFWVSG
jgi:hypothetical protein